MFIFEYRPADDSQGLLDTFTLNIGVTGIE